MERVRILLVTGASGVGKTTLVQRVESRGLAGVSFHYFDSIGVPSAGQMVADHGSPSQWQVAMTHRWIERLARDASGLRVLEGQVRPSTAREAFTRYGVDGHILLVDCAHAVREARLRDDRKQPGLNTRDMECWASYLRGQADALDLPVLDTSTMTTDAAAAALHAHIGALASAWQ